MINVVYLVLVLTQSTGTASVTIPQANMAQCQANAENYKKVGSIRKTYCIVGVMPK